MFESNGVSILVLMEGTSELASILQALLYPYAVSILVLMEGTSELEAITGSITDEEVSILVLMEGTSELIFS